MIYWARAIPPTPDPQAGRVYDRVYAIYRELYGLLGSERARLLHELKHIRTERS